MFCVCGKESPLTFVSYQVDEGDAKDTPIALDQHGKDEYLKVVNTLIIVPKIVGEVNEVTLRNNIEVSNFKSEQKVERASTMKMILGIIIFAFIVSIIVNFFLN